MKPRLLVIELHHLGDAVLALPFLRAAARTFEVSVLCRPGVAQVFRAASDDWTVLAPEGGWLARQPVLPKLGQGDVAVCAWPDPRAQRLMRESGAERRIGFTVTERNFYGVARAWRKRRLILGKATKFVWELNGSLLTDSLDRSASDQKHLENWAQIARVLLLEPDYTFPWITIESLPAGVAEFVTKARAEQRPLCAVHTGGRLPTKRWPLARFQALLDGFFPENRIAAIVVAAPNEEAAIPHGEWQVAFTTESLSALCAVFSSVDAVLCNDSFASHVAAAMGQRVVTIFGSGDPAWFAPYQNEAHVVASTACPFRPCVDRCEQPSILCLETLSNDLVEKSLKAVIFPADARGLSSISPQ